MKPIVYPGSFDPLTNGHIDVISRLQQQFGEVIVLVADTKHKNTLFSAAERTAMIQEIFKTNSNVQAQLWDGLLVDFLQKNKYTVIGKGLRSVKDFEYELDMAHTNKSLYPEMETIFVLTRPQLSFVSSSLVKEVANFGGDISKFVPTVVEQAVLKKLKKG